MSSRPEKTYRVVHEGLESVLTISRHSYGVSAWLLTPGIGNRSVPLATAKRLLQAPAAVLVGVRQNGFYVKTKHARTLA